MIRFFNNEISNYIEIFDNILISIPSKRLWIQVFLCDDFFDWNKNLLVGKIFHPIRLVLKSGKEC